MPPWSLPWCPSNAPVDNQNVLIGCPLPRRKCLGALALLKTKHTGRHIPSGFQWSSKRFPERRLFSFLRTPSLTPPPTPTPLNSQIFVLQAFSTTTYVQIKLFKGVQIFYSTPYMYMYVLHQGWTVNKFVHVINIVQCQWGFHSSDKFQGCRGNQFHALLPPVELNISFPTFLCVFHDFYKVFTLLPT